MSGFTAVRGRGAIARILGVSVVGALTFGQSFGLLSGVSIAEAQQLDRYNQGFPQGRKKEVKLDPKDNVAVSEDETEILPRLNGAIIINSPDELAEGGASASGVEARGDIVPDAVVAAAKAYVGEPISLASLDRMTRDMVLAYRDAGMPVVNVVVPPQDVSNGVVQIIAVVGRLGEVMVEGNASDPDYYTEGFELAQGDVVEQAKVLDQLRWKSRRFHRRVDAIYAPGSGFSLTDISFNVTEKKPWTVYLGADKTGSGSLGQNRIFAGFTAGDLWGLDHELSYQFTTSEKGIDTLGAHVASYIFPVANRTDFQISGSYTENEARINDTTISSGRSKTLSGTFISQLPRWNDWSVDARYGFDYKHSTNSLEFGGANVTETPTAIGQFGLQLSGQRGGSNSATSVYGGLWWAPGGLFGDNTDDAMSKSRSDAKASYVYVRGGFDHTVYLPDDRLFNIGVDGQYAGVRLPKSEMMYIGGMNSVRGFDENTLAGDNGLVARLELHGAKKKIRDWDGKEDSFRPFIFLDAGLVEVNAPMAEAESDGSIVGAGVGFSYAVGENFSFEAAYGWKLAYDEAMLSKEDNDDGEFHFRVMTRY